MLAIYCRTSRNRPEKHTIENQREGGIFCAKQLGIGFRVYVDDGISGTLDDSVRDGLSDLFRDMRKKEITHVYCIDQSRIERNSRTWEFFVAECLNNNVKYYPSGSFFDLENITNRMFAKLMSIVNAYYSEITSKKVRLANARKAKDGKTHGLKAYGYAKDENNKYIIYEPEAKNVRRMFELSLKGYGTYTIANIFNKEKIPTKFSGNFTGTIKRKEKFTKKETLFDKSKIRWRGNVIHDILRNKIYKGIREWNRYEDRIEFVDGQSVKTKFIEEQVVSQITPIITPELWDRVNNNLEKNKKNVGRKSQYRYLLNGLIICSECNRDFVGKKRLASGDNAYKCKGKIYPHPDCKSSRGISINKLDSFIIKHLFIEKGLKKHLQGLAENTEQKKGLERRLANEQGVLNRKEAELEVAYKRLLSTKFKDDKHIEAHVITLKNVVYNQKRLVDDLQNEVNQSETNTRNKRITQLINSYVEGIEFDELKSIMHSLIDWIKIKHHKTNGKMGDFLVEVKYKRYDETSTFLTNWQANKWLWLSNYRDGANNKKQLQEDRQDSLDLLEFYGIKITKTTLANFKKASGYNDEQISKMNPFSDDFAGIQVSTGLLGTIELSDSDILYFD
jgi:site-specific DNA recombinase